VEPAQSSPVESCLQQVRKAEFHWASKAKMLGGWELIAERKIYFCRRQIGFHHFHPCRALVSLKA
jgi:hypothetical protein